MSNETYAVTVHWEPLKAPTDHRGDAVEVQAMKAVGWPEARKFGRHTACLAGAIAIVIRDEDGEIVGHWDRYSNIWRDQDVAKAIRAQERTKVADEIAAEGDRMRGLYPNVSRTWHAVSLFARGLQPDRCDGRCLTEDSTQPCGQCETDISEAAAAMQAEMNHEEIR